MINNVGLVLYAKKQLGQAYMWGTFGQTITEPFVAQKARQYPKIYTPNYINKCRKNIGKLGFDCIGLIKAYYMDGKYGIEKDIGADRTLKIAKEKGAINTLPEIPGVLVHFPGHVGIYVGNGEVIEARGVDYGVVQTKLKERHWKSWSKCSFIDYEADAFETAKKQVQDKAELDESTMEYLLAYKHGEELIKKLAKAME